MRSVEVKANMVDGFYTGSARDCGYSFGVYYSRIQNNNAHEWTFGGEYLQSYKPYGEKGRIPIAEFIGEAGYNLHLYSNYSQFFHLYGGISALAGYETVKRGKALLPERSNAPQLGRIHLWWSGQSSKPISISQTESPSPPTSKRDSFSVIQRGHCHFSYEFGH